MRRAIESAITVFLVLLFSAAALLKERAWPFNGEPPQASLVKELHNGDMAWMNRSGEPGYCAIAVNDSADHVWIALRNHAGEYYHLAFADKQSAVDFVNKNWCASK